MKPGYGLGRVPPGSDPPGWISESYFSQHTNQGGGCKMYLSPAPSRNSSSWIVPCVKGA